MGKHYYTNMGATLSLMNGDTVLTTMKHLIDTDEIEPSQGFKLLFAAYMQTVKELRELNKNPAIIAGRFVNKHPKSVIGIVLSFLLLNNIWNIPVLRLILIDLFNVDPALIAGLLP